MGTGLAVTLLVLGAGCIVLACYLTKKPSHDEHEDYEDREG